MYRNTQFVNILQHHLIENSYHYFYYLYVCVVTKKKLQQIIEKIIDAM